MVWVFILDQVPLETDPDIDKRGFDAHAFVLLYMPWAGLPADGLVYRTTYGRY